MSLTANQQLLFPLFRSVLREKQQQLFLFTFPWTEGREGNILHKAEEGGRHIIAAEEKTRKVVWLSDI